MILHLKPDDDESLGHFVVRMPQSTDNNIVIVDGLSGVYSKPYSEFYEKMSGVVLLCSPDPITDDVVAAYRRIALWHWGIGLIGLVFSIAFFYRWCSGCVKNSCKTPLQSNVDNSRRIADNMLKCSFD